MHILIVRKMGRVMIHNTIVLHGGEPMHHQKTKKGSFKDGKVPYRIITSSLEEPKGRFLFKYSVNNLKPFIPKAKRTSSFPYASFMT